MYAMEEEGGLEKDCNSTKEMESIIKKGRER